MSEVVNTIIVIGICVVFLVDASVAIIRDYQSARRDYFRWIHNGGR